MGRRARWGLILLLLGLTGCVERRMLIVSDPPAATAFVNGKNVGMTPVSVPFDYYGKYDVMLVRDGYQTKTYPAAPRRRWFEFFPFDFFSENVWPLHIQRNFVMEYTLEPIAQPRTEDVLNDANQLRDRAQGVAPK